MQHLNLRDALQDSIDDIDSVLGKGYAKANPELIAVMLKAKCNQDIAETFSDHLRSIDDTIEKGIMYLCENFRTCDVSPVSNGLEGIDSALECVAAAIGGEYKEHLEGRRLAYEQRNNR